MSNSSNKNQGRPENGGTMSGQIHEQGQRLQDAAGQVGDRLREGYSAASDAVSEKYRQAGEVVSRNPGSSVMVGFGIGFGLGVLVTLLFRQEEPWYDRYVPDSLRNVPDRLRHLHIPESISRHMPGH